MLRKMAARFSRLVELDLSFYPGITDSDLKVIADGLVVCTCLACSIAEDGIGLI